MGEHSRFHSHIHTQLKGELNLRRLLFEWVVMPLIFITKRTPRFLRPHESRQKRQGQSGVRWRCGGKAGKPRLSHHSHPPTHTTAFFALAVFLLSVFFRVVCHSQKNLFRCCVNYSQFSKVATAIEKPYKP